MKVEIVAPSLSDERSGDVIVKPLDTQEEAIRCFQQAQIHCPWYPKEYFEGWLTANREGNRLTRLVFHEGKLAGWCHLLRVSDYPSFQEEQIPEINDLVIFPEFRRKKLASRLLEELERAAAAWNCARVGLGVGLYGDYGPAQLLYAKRGYHLDGKGMSYKNQRVKAGQEVPIDDELLVYLVKDL
ncbi:GNAT family N-acetyltransferase [Gorillibacterium sp. CAU 1737]|uniref:GNAT family N-acetyltransferase n=1 Tax=Gorillibacterium sp. CAU 1737 TaxID=3140362 RepID=UPI003260A8BB